MESVSGWPSEPLSSTASGTCLASPALGLGVSALWECGQGDTLLVLCGVGGGHIPREGALCPEPVPEMLGTGFLVLPSRLSRTQDGALGGLQESHQPEDLELCSSGVEKVKSC